jgi:hypothetical protein
MRTEMEIEALEDMRVLVQSRCLGAAGVMTARMHAHSLMQKAMLAAEQQQHERAEQFRQRFVEFVQRIDVGDILAHYCY